jgi:nucleoside-diphosphate-sugar epimerase
MQALVTGVAGFIGSHLAEQLRRDGWRVRGIDSFTTYYDPEVKRRNLDPLSGDADFELVEADLGDADLEGVLDGVDVVFHQAGQPGVRLSWAAGFPTYVAQNVLATQRLLEACRNAQISRLVYASSSSVYGNAVRYPTEESDLPAPHSPYGVTKLAGEQLCGLYAANWKLPTVALRYFTVYGPRQRPDMGFHRFVESVLADQPLPLFGDGEQVRDFTYVGDVVAANVLAATADVAPGEVVNIAGGGSITVNNLLDLLGTLTGREVRIERLPEQAGDVRQTGGSIDRAAKLLGWQPEVTIAGGLEQQIAWHRARAPK